MDRSLGPDESQAAGAPQGDGPGTGGQSANAEESRTEGALPRKPLAELEEKIGYTFKERQYLVNALIHKSYLHAVPDFPLGSNERLEFLGDSILGFIVSSDLFAAQPGMTEGQLSALRGALVRLNTLAELAEPLEIGQYLYMSHGEEAAGGRARGSNMGRAIEAVLGAVYLDGGLEAATEVWHKISGGRSLEQLQEVLRSDYKSALQQFTQAHLKATPEYRIVGTSGPEHSKQFHVEVRVGDRVLAGGVGRNKQIAEQAAAETALADLKAQVPVKDEPEESVGEKTEGSMEEAEA
ncbi:MAG: ribonuclease III [Chloroflexota bacterium]|nr:ribonuclease III [Chloroflexota bacterium]MDQ5866471.1 ribonuclease III [Chloroflexota bacterium]